MRRLLSAIVCCGLLITGGAAGDDDLIDLAIQIADERADVVRSQDIVIDCTTRIATQEVIETLPPAMDPRSALSDSIDLVFFSRERWTLTFVDDDTFRIGRELIESAPIEAGTAGDRSVKVSNHDYVRSVNWATREGDKRVGASVFVERPHSWTRHPVIEWCGMQLAYLPWGYSLTGVIRHADSRGSALGDSVNVVNEGYVDQTRFELSFDRNRGSLDSLEVIESAQGDQGEFFVCSGRILQGLSPNREPLRKEDRARMVTYLRTADGTILGLAQYDMEIIATSPRDPTDDSMCYIDVPSNAAVGDERYRAAYRIGEDIMTLDGVPYRTDRPIRADAADDPMSYIRTATELRRGPPRSALTDPGAWILIGTGAVLAVIFVVVRMRRG